MAFIINGEAIRALVLADGQPREAQDDAGHTLMLWREDGLVRSGLLADWPAEQARLAALEQERLDALALRQQILTVAQSAVGVAFDQLLAGQVRALFAIVLRKEGALDKDGKVRALGEWVK